MATVEKQVHHAVRGHRSGTGTGRHHGRDSLAEVIMIRQPSARPPRAGLIGSLVTKARVFASPRVQATSVRSTPRPPSSPAPLRTSHTTTTTTYAPNDVA
jgi:hypothetical protein